MRVALAAALLGLACGCASAPDAPHPEDPWEGYNRRMHDFNDALDRGILRPAAVSYRDGVPGFAQEGVSNFFGNLEDIGTGLNNILQGKVAQGASDLARFGINSVVGIAGLWDVATPMGLDKHNEDFGQTLGWWGMPPGPYFVIPVLGPSTLRDAPARYVDPSTVYARAVDPEWIWYSAYALDAVRGRARLLRAEKVLDEAALDRYSFTRDAWLQRRRSHVYDGRPPREPDDE